MVRQLAAPEHLTLWLLDVAPPVYVEMGAHLIH